VILDPDQSVGIDEELAWHFKPDGEQVGLHLRNGIAAITDGTQARLAIELDLPTWANILSGKARLSEAIARGEVKAIGDPARILALLACFDHPSLGL
jgi:alkyl sulfatase BDS1-like metallo-beta-lactamase superfamily hydrolase